MLNKELYKTNLKSFVDLTNVFFECFFIQMWETNMRKFIAAFLMSLALASNAQALTFKKVRFWVQMETHTTALHLNSWIDLLNLQQQKTCQLALLEITFLLLSGIKFRSSQLLNSAA